MHGLSDEMVIASYIKVVRIMMELCGFRNIVVLFGLSFVLMLLDLLGVLLIAKLIQEMVNPGSFQDFLFSLNLPLSGLTSLITGFINNANALVVISVTFILRVGFSILSLNWISHVIYNVRAAAEYTLTKRLVTCEIVQLRSQTKDEVVRDIILDLDLLNSCLRAIASITTEFFVILILFASLFVFSFDVLGVFALAGLMFASMMWILLRRLKSLGVLRRRLEAGRYSNIFSIINLSSEVRIFNVAKNLLRNFSLHTGQLVEAERLHFLLGFLHRYLAEIVVFGTISVMMVTEFSNNLTPEIGILFGVILLRVLPTINRVGSSLNTLAYANPSLKALETRLLHARLSSSISEDPINQVSQTLAGSKTRISFKNFSMRIGHSEILNNLNLSLPLSGLVSIVGPSGIGKTTFAEILLGLIPKNHGAVQWGGEICVLKDTQFGYVPQNVHLMERSLKENICFFDEKDEVEYTNILKILEITHLHSADRKQEKLSDVGSVSGGERQRIGIARAFANEANVLILDEVTSNLDSVVAEKLLMTLQQIAKRSLVLVITHDPKVVAQSDRVVKFA